MRSRQSCERQQFMLLPAAVFVIGLLVLGVLLGVPGAALAQAAPDAFYLALLRDGKAEMSRGDASSAKKSFRLACFGFLEQPALLAEGLVRLGLAESVLHDREAFVATFTRLAEVEERFAAYATAALSATERQAFEERAVEWVPPEVLRSLPSFAPLLGRKAALDLSKLSARERLRELERLAATDPGNPHWRVLLAQDEAADNRMAKVLARLEGVPDGADAGLAGCLRGRALAGLDRCAEAVAPLSACAALTADPQLAAAQLDCLVDLKRDEAARELAEKITRPAAEAPAVRKAMARIPERPVERVVAAREEAPPSEKPAAAPEKGRVKEEEPEIAKQAGQPSGLPTAEAVKPPTARPAPTPANSPVAVPPPVPVAADPKPAGAPPPVPAPASSPPAANAVEPAAAKPATAKPATAKPHAAKLTTEEERLVADARTMLKSEENRDALRRGLALIRPVADRLPGRSDLQLLVGEIAYRAGLWTAGADYFQRSTPGGRGPVDPTLRFYYAVCLYEAGDFAGAAQVASTGLEKLQRPPFVESYLQKIRTARP